MSTVSDLQRFFTKESWQNRIAYGVLLLFAVLYLLTQMLMAIMWVAGEAPLNSI